MLQASGQIDRRYGFFGLGINAELLPVFYIVLKSYRSPKANAKISQRRWLLKTRPWTFTPVTYKHCTYLPSATRRAGQRLRNFRAVTLDRMCNECSVRHCSIATPSPASLSLSFRLVPSLPPLPRLPLFFKVQVAIGSSCESKTLRSRPFCFCALAAEVEFNELPNMSALLISAGCT